MNIAEFTKPVTAKTLNESLAKKFGQRISLESFTLEQLQNARNKLRTKMSQVEMTENFSTVVESDAYSKSKAMLDVLNAEISERGDIEETSIEEAKPDYIDLDGDGDKKEPMKKAAKDAKKKKTDESKSKVGQEPQPYKLGADKFCKPGFVLDSKTRMCMPKAPKGMSQAQFNAKKESIVREGAEDQAEIVMAAKDMVDRVTNWMEDTAEMQTESMLELADAIRDEMGSEKAEAFTTSIKPSLEAMYTAMETTRGALSNGVGLLTGEGEVEAPMGAPDEMGGDMEPTVDMEGDPALDMPLDAEAPAAGGEEPMGREQRESVDPRKLAKTLSKKK